MLITATAQTDSVTANYIKSMADRIETDLDGDIELSADTTIIDNDSAMTVHTSYYFNRAGEIEKIMEKSLFGTVTTEIAVYYNARSPILFSTKQWQGSDLKIDFDYYFQTNNPVYLVKREFGRGKPNSDEILKWCSQLLKESDGKKLAKMNEVIPTQKKTISTKTKDSTTTTKPTKRSFFPFFKKKKKS